MNADDMQVLIDLRQQITTFIDTGLTTGLLEGDEIKKMTYGPIWLSCNKYKVELKLTPIP